MTSPVSNFAGSMQQLIFNGMPYLEMARAQVPGPRSPGAVQSSARGPQITVTATIGKRDSQLVHHPVHFKSKHTFVGLPTLKAYTVTNIYFQVSYAAWCWCGVSHEQGRGSWFRRRLLTLCARIVSI